MAVISLPRVIFRFRQRWLLVALLFVFLAVSMQYTIKAVGGNRSAVIRWQEALRKLKDGEDIYSKYVHPNSPTMAVLLLPFAYLPPLVAGLGWFYSKVILTLLTMHWVFRLVESPGRPFPDWAKGLAAFLSLGPIIGDLSHGNVNLFILFLIVAALFTLHTGRALWAGVILALAITCKVTPALFVPYFLWKRQWKMLAGCAAGMPLFLFVLPGLVLGMGENAERVGSWANQMLRPFVVEGKVFYSEHNNQSLPGVASRLLTQSPSFSTYRENVYVPLAYHNLLSLPPGVVPWLRNILAAGFVVVVIWACRTPARSSQNWRLAAEYSLIVLGMLFFSERTWKHHCVTLLLPFAVLVYCLAASSSRAPPRWYLVATLSAAALLIASTSTGIWSPLDRVGELAQVYGAYVWAYVVLAAAVVVLLRRRDPSFASSASSSPLAVANDPVVLYKRA